MKEQIDLTPEAVLEAIREKYPNADIQKVTIQTRDRNALGITKREQRLDLSRKDGTRTS